MPFSHRRCKPGLLNALPDLPGLACCFDTFSGSQFHYCRPFKLSMGGDDRQARMLVNAILRFAPTGQSNQTSTNVQQNYDRHLPDCLLQKSSVFHSTCKCLMTILETDQPDGQPVGKELQQGTGSSTRSCQFFGKLTIDTMALG